MATVTPVAGASHRALAARLPGPQGAPHPHTRPAAQRRYPPTLRQGRAPVPGPAPGKRQRGDPARDGTQLQPRSR